MMRQLSKIILIHSANIPYAEIRVDGNVHFSGTQGVGKSTILRALLFFYNADPSRLGIRIQGQKKFDQFYLPHSNSYIVYEVERDGDRPFCVIVSRQNARAVYRFADGPFCKEWLIDERGIVTGDPVEVRRRVQKSGIDISNIITSYTDYRDILYGNTHSKLQHSNSRYSLMRSTRYDNLPRIVTNVFLNERVDADFIKDTLIKSMGEEEPVVRLKLYAEQLRNLSEIFHDTLLWTKPNRKGEIETLSKAKIIIEKGNEIISHSAYIRELCGQLNYAFQEAQRKLPTLKIDLQEVYAKLGRLNERKENLSRDHDKEQKKLTMELGVVNNNVTRAKEAQSRYEAEGIENILHLEAEKPRYEGEREHLQSQIMTLEHKAGDVAGRFDRLMEGRKGNHLIFKRETEAKMVENQKKLNEELLSLRKATDLELDMLEETYNRKEETVVERKEARANDVHKVELRIQEIRHVRLYAKEIEKLQNQRNELEAEQKELSRKDEALSLKLEAITGSIDNERLRIEDEHRPGILEAERAIEETVMRMEEEKSLLQKSKGSLIEWLDLNVEGWTETIGRVADEKGVLYNTGLSPRLASQWYDSFFGVKLDLSGLDTKVRTPDEIRAYLESLNEGSANLKSKLKALLEERDKEITKSKTRRMAEFNATRREKESVRGRLIMLPQRISHAIDDLNSLLRKAEEERQGALRALELEREKAIKELNNAKGEIDTLRGKRKSERKAVEKKRKQKEESLRLQTEKMNSHLQETILADAKEAEMEIEKLDAQKREALKKEGVNTDILLDWRAKLTTVEAMLAKIEHNHDHIVVYLREKEEYIDKLEDFKAKRDSLLAKQAEMDEKYRQKSEKLQREINEATGSKDALKVAIAGLHEDISESRDFMGKPSCPPYLREMPELTTSDSCRVIIRNIRDYSDSVRNGMETLKRGINLFREQFKQARPFNFPTDLETDKDYLNYAESVRIFVENDIISDYITTSNGLYTNVLGQISREYATLAEREAEIRKVVNEVNSDFAKKSFAGVIRRIELRLDRSESLVISTLRNIHEFWTEHGLDIGESNLFSFEEKDSANLKAVEWLRRLSGILEENKNIEQISLTDNFSLKMNIEENDNSTGWIDNMKNVGSDGTDILVKAIINILLINVFKKRIGKKSGSFAMHCMMDEIGKLAEENIKGIVDFANARDIYIVNSAPKVHSPLSYRHIYMLTKDERANTYVHPILSLHPGKDSQSVKDQDNKEEML